jgi:hypothetical protein
MEKNMSLIDRAEAAERNIGISHARVAELEAVADGSGLTHTIAIAPGVVVYGNAEAAATLEGIMATVNHAKSALGM